MMLKKVFCIISILLLLTTYQFASSSSSKILFLKGKVWIKQSRGKWRKAQKANKINPDDLIKTGDNSLVKLQLSDGSKVLLRSNSFASLKSLIYIRKQVKEHIKKKSVYSKLQHLTKQNRKKNLGSGGVRGEEEGVSKPDSKEEDLSTLINEALNKTKKHEAIEMLKPTLKKYKDVKSIYQVHFHLGNLYTSKGDASKGKRHYQKVLDTTLKKKNYFLIRSKFMYAVCLGIEENYVDGVKKLNELLGSCYDFETLIESHLLLSQYYLKLGKKKKADIHIKKAKEYFPDN